MPARRLSAEERALWRRVTETVQPLRGHAPSLTFEPLDTATPLPAPLPSDQRPPSKPAVRIVRAGPGETLDGSWDRRLGRGLVSPERTIDLHGHSLATAHAALDQGLDRAIADGVRLLLLVTGRPPRPQRDGGPIRRGAIRASIGDWLAGSRHAGHIAAVRNAHPRHGGAGALYIILRRPR